MIIIKQGLLDVLNGSVLAPAELVRKGLPVGRASDRRAIQLVAGADVLVVHGNFIVMRQRSAGVVIRRLCQGQRQTGEVFKETGLGIVFLGVPAGDEFAGPLRRCLCFRSLPRIRVE